MHLLNPVFHREMLLLRTKMLRFGYLVSTLLFPLLYLFAFGWGLGSRVVLSGGSYVNFLVPGLLAMTAMNNSFNLSAGSVGMGRLYSRTMQPILIAPVSRCSIVNGYLLAGLVRGLIGCSIVALAALFLFGSASLPLTLPAVTGLLLAMTFFALAGLLVGLVIKDLEDIAVITNFVIMPMAFFSGTFFPLDRIPELLRMVLTILPLTQANLLLRSQSFTPPALFALCLLMSLCVATYGAAWSCLERYQE